MLLQTQKKIGIISIDHVTRPAAPDQPPAVTAAQQRRPVSGERLGDACQTRRDPRLGRQGYTTAGKQSQIERLLSKRWSPLVRADELSRRGATRTMVLRRTGPGAAQAGAGSGLSVALRARRRRSLPLDRQPVFPCPLPPGATALVQEIPPTAAGCVRTARRAQRLVKRARQKSPPDPELQAVTSAWATPPGEVRTGIKATVAAAARELEWRWLARHYLDNSGHRPTRRRAKGAGGYDPRARGRHGGLLTGHWDGGCNPPPCALAITRLAEEKTGSTTVGSCAASEGTLRAPRRIASQVSSFKLVEQRECVGRRPAPMLRTSPSQAKSIHFTYIHE
jgi:hypothetical protein